MDLHAFFEAANRNPIVAAVNGTKIFDFWYDVIPTVAATLVVIACILLDRARRKGGQ